MVIRFIYKVFVLIRMVTGGFYELTRRVFGPSYGSIIFIGPPGAGKDTQADMLKQYDYVNFSTSQMFRDLNKETNIGALVSELINKVKFVPDDLTIKIFIQTLREYRQNGDYNPKLETLVLNGIPRNINQVESVNQIVDVKDVIYFQIRPELCEQRLLRMGREEEDTIEKIRKRQKDFVDETYLLPDQYEGLVKVVDASRTPEEVHESVKEALNIH